MTLRERIADWISGGELTRAKHDAREGWAEGYRYRVEAELCKDGHDEWYGTALLLQDQLNRIAACETTNANATVRRMARIAREAME